MVHSSSSRTPLAGGPLNGFLTWPLPSSLSLSSSQLLGSALLCCCACAFFLGPWKRPLQQQLAQIKGSAVAAAAAATTTAAATIGKGRRRKSRRQEEDVSAAASGTIIPSPRTSEALGAMTQADRENLPYPPDGALPGARDVATPYGSVRVYEWGPEDGERVLLLAGISTPTLSLGDLAWEMSGRGYRVMLFDYFGRGYSDAPVNVEYGAALYVTQILLVLASSRLGRGGWDRFHLVGYSLGGCLAVAFARYFSHRVTSLTLIAGAGLIRPRHVNWKSWLLYQSGLLPEALVKWVVRRRIRPNTASTSGSGGRKTDIMAAESRPSSSHPYVSSSSSGATDGDANGGQGFDSAPISRRRPGVSVADVVAHQIDTHAGFVHAFASTMRHAPIYAPQEDWVVLRELLARARKRGVVGGGAGHRVVTTEIQEVGKKANNEVGQLGNINEEDEDENDEEEEGGLVKGKVLLVLGAEDPVIVPEETIEDAEAVLGREGVEYVVLAAGHELPITQSCEVADVMQAFFRR